MPSAFRIVGAVVIAGTLFVAGAVRPLTPVRREAVPGVKSGALSARATGGSTAAIITALQARLREEPSDWRAAAALGLSYVQQARMTADPTFYPRAERALRLSMRVRRDNVDALVGMGSLALARHEFREALVWGRRAVAANGHGVAGIGIVGDALAELGRYRDAFRAFQRMADIRPGLLAYARASYARELQGDVAGARRLMRMAEEAAGSSEDAAWAAFELGELFWSVGKLDEAEAAYRRAVSLAPSFVPPRGGLARVSWARGRMAEAIRRYRWAVDRYPAPEHVAALGDLYQAASRKDLAADQYALVRAEQELLKESGVDVDLELALFDADHGRPRRALMAARTAWSKRKSIHAADALAWALHRNGRDGQASRLAMRALRLGSGNALFVYHAAIIELGRGHEERARHLLSAALRTNPFFSIRHAGIARRTLARLEAGA